MKKSLLQKSLSHRQLVGGTNLRELGDRVDESAPPGAATTSSTGALHDQLAHPLPGLLPLHSLLQSDRGAAHHHHGLPFPSPLLQRGSAGSVLRSSLKRWRRRKTRCCVHLFHFLHCLLLLTLLHKVVVSCHLSRDVFILDVNCIFAFTFDSRLVQRLD